MAQCLFQATMETMMGSTVVAVGSHELLGIWQPSAGLVLRTSHGQYPEWRSECNFPLEVLESETVEYKFAVLLPDGSCIWESGENRRLRSAVPTEFSSRWQLSNIMSGNEAWKLREEAFEVDRGAPATLTIDFSATWPCSLPGDCLVLVGSAPELGAWQPDAGVHLSTCASTFPAWAGTAHFHRPASDGLRIEWKLVILRASGRREWEEGSNRSLDMPGLAGSWILEATFGQPSEQWQLCAQCSISCQRCPDLQPMIFRSISPETTYTDCGTTLCGEELELGSSFSDNEGSVDLDTSWSDQLAQTVIAVLNFPAKDSICHHETSRSLFLFSGAAQLAKDNGPLEDACFFSAWALGVADGVGQLRKWAHYGLDSGAYAADLMRTSAESLASGRLQHQQQQQQQQQQDPAILAASAMAAAERGTKSYGAATICLMVLGEILCAPDGALENEESAQQRNMPNAGIANLGDSGFMLLRHTAAVSQGMETHEHGPSEGMQVVARSCEQQHSWNCPYQLMRLPTLLAERAASKSIRADTAEDCNTYQLHVQAGDLLLMYSDGLVDNLFEEEILSVVNASLQSPRELKPGMLADALAQAAWNKSLDPTAEVPFARASSAQGMHFPGGKQDDITVVAAWVMPSSASGALRESRTPTYLPG
eukprot:TRINITY_DN4620_c0_g3_i4.p1 TRINITY_DN4620_c0_g3~~TRINITY_DN4620_c0_g3_i4.p1  ORF type:complete len:704 (+),score=135.51 TRINITY_DN4620_c0_g3_i4:157-2112(+)